MNIWAITFIKRHTLATTKDPGFVIDMFNR